MDGLTDRRENRTGKALPFAAAQRGLFPPLRNRTLATAADALSRGEVATAETVLAKYLSAKPDDPEALNLVAEIARRSKRLGEAERLLARCVGLKPDCAGYRYNYAVVLRRLGRDEQALAELDELLRSDARNPLFRDQKATVLARMGRYAEAFAARRELLDDYPASAELWLRYGYALRDEGLQEDCVAAFRKALELAPTLTAAYAALASLKVYRFAASEMSQMEAQLASPVLAADDRADLHFALGDAYEKEKSYGKAFENFAKGNAQRRLALRVDLDPITAHCAACETLFTREFFQGRSGWGCPSSAPVFIVGMPRSGSTLLEQILSSHSAIEGLGELNDLAKIPVWPLGAEACGAGKDSPAKTRSLMHTYLREITHADRDRLRSAGEEYLEFVQRRRATNLPVFTDKTLSNYFFVGLIHLILPNARIIDARRHPLDCGWSCFKSQFGGGNQPFSYRLSDIGRYYADYVRLMAHFDRVLPGRIYRVVYENLVADPEAEVRKLLQYLDLPFEEQCLRFHENRRAIGTQSSEQVRVPLYTSGVGQWLPYEPWLGPLKDSLGAVLDAYPNAPE